MRLLSFGDFITMRTPSRDRIFFHSIWFKGHNNARYERLLPRLSRLDAYLVTCSDRRVLRALEFRALRRTQRFRYWALLGAASRRYESMLTTDPEQIPYFSGRIVADLDDPRFTGREVALLSRSNVLAYVVTHERAASRYRSLGLTKPYVVIPQGVSADAIDPRRVTNLRFQLRRSDKVVIGYVAAWLLTASDPGGANPLYNIDHLLEIWTDIHQRVPNARLSLIGQPGANVYRLCAGRNDVLLLGRLPYEEVLNQVAAFDIALYPRRAHQAGTRTMKMAEYMTLGVPTVAYDQEVTSDLRASQGGVLVMSPQQFVEAVSALAADPEKRTRMGEAAKRYAGSWRWDNLTTRYEREVFDQYLNDTQSI